MLYLVAAFILLSTNFAVGAEPIAQAQPLGRPNAPAFEDASTPAVEETSQRAGCVCTIWGC